MDDSNNDKLLSENILFIRLFLARLSFLRFGEKCLLESKITSINDFLSLSLDDLSLMVGRILKTTIWNPSFIKKMVERDIKLMESYNAGVLFYDSKEYPYLLREIYDPPYALFYRGNTQILNRPAVAIVGTRKPSQEGAIKTKSVAQRITEAGINIVSGLAFGIDAQAHMGSLLAQGSALYGKTIAVLGSGVDNITPSSNKRLAAAILASGGCIISEYPLASSVHNWQFVQRNRIISALSRVVVVMQAPRGSGALITADFAIEHNRELCFFEEFIHSDDGYLAEHIKLKNKKSIQDYVQDGASIVNSGDDVLSLVNSMTFLEEREYTRKKLDKINELL